MEPLSNPVKTQILRTLSCTCLAQYINFLEFKGIFLHEKTIKGERVSDLHLTEGRPYPTEKIEFPEDSLVSIKSSNVTRRVEIKDTIYNFTYEGKLEWLMQNLKPMIEALVEKTIEELKNINSYKLHFNEPYTPSIYPQVFMRDCETMIALKLVEYRPNELTALIDFVVLQ